MHAANIDDRATYLDMIGQGFNKPVTTYADSGYVGKQFKEQCALRNNIMVAVPKKNRDGKLSHTIDQFQKKFIKRHRGSVELVNSHIKAFRGVAVKHVKRIDSYKCFLFLRVVLLALYNGIVLKGLIKTPLKLINKLKSD